MHDTLDLYHHDRATTIRLGRRPALYIVSHQGARSKDLLRLSSLETVERSPRRLIC